MHDGGARMGDLFSGFSRYGQALVAMIGYFIAVFLIGLPGQILTQIGARPPARLWLLGLGYAISLGIAIFVTSRLNFAPFLIVDRNLGIGEALSVAWSRTAALKGPIALLPWLSTKITSQYPGTRLAFTEWNYGGGGHISGAVATADVLGVFGRDGVALACIWPLNADERFTYAGLRAFRNYDGRGGAFGDVSLPATSSDRAAG